MLKADKLTKKIKQILEQYDTKVKAYNVLENTIESIRKERNKEVK